MYEPQIDPNFPRGKSRWDRWLVRGGRDLRQFIQDALRVKVGVKGPLTHIGGHRPLQDTTRLAFDFCPAKFYLRLAPQLAADVEGIGLAHSVVENEVEHTEFRSRGRSPQFL